MKLTCRPSAARPTLLGILFGSCLLLPLAAWAQEEASQKTAKYLPADTLGVVSLWPKQMASREQMQLMPLEVLTAAGKEHVGIDPLDIERIDVAFGFPGPAGPQFGGLLQLAKAFDLQDLNPKMFGNTGLQRDGTFEYLQMTGPEEIIVHQIDPQTVVVGTKIFVKQMVSSRDSLGQIASITASINSQQDAMAVISISTLRPLLAGVLDGAGQQLPPPIAGDLNKLLQSTDFVALRVVLENETIQLVLAGADEAATTQMEQSLGNLIGFVQETFVGEMKKQIPADTPTNLAMHQYIDRLSGEMSGKLTPRRSGNRLIMQFDQLENIGVIGTLTGLLLPAVQAARQSARRMQSSNNLKELALAMHNHHDAFRSFPATAIVDADDTPLLSWRVKILPFIEQNALYEKFHLDEPWDSEHNIKLLDQMPRVFLHPSRPTKAGHTVYQAPVSDQSLLRLTEPTKLASILDGTSNTIMLLETASNAAVPWTAPQDYEIDEANPKLNLFLQGITQAAFGDGSVRVLAESIDENTLRALYTRDGGERVDINF